MIPAHAAPTVGASKVDTGEPLRRGLDASSWLEIDLWIAAIGMGSNLNVVDLADITAGRRLATAGEYDVLAATLNERLADLGREVSVAYWDELAR